MTIHDPDLPLRPTVTPEALSCAAQAILLPLLENAEHHVLASFAEAIFRGTGPVLGRLSDRGLAALLQQEAETAARPGLYGRLEGVATAQDLDGPVWRAGPALKERVGDGLAARLAAVHQLATHPGDPLPIDDADGILRRIVLLTRLATPTSAEAVSARLMDCIAARVPRDLDLAVHRLRLGLKALEPGLPGLQQTLWQMAVLDRTFGAHLLTGLAHADHAHGLDAHGAAEASFAEAVRASGALIARDDIAATWDRCFGARRNKDRDTGRDTGKAQVYPITQARAKTAS